MEIGLQTNGSTQTSASKKDDKESKENLWYVGKKKNAFLFYYFFFLLYAYFGLKYLMCHTFITKKKYDNLFIIYLKRKDICIY